MIMNTLVAMTLGLVLNMILGRPAIFAIVESLIVNTAKRMKKALEARYQDTAEAHRMAGGVLVFFMLLTFAVIPLVLVILAYLLLPVVGILLEALLFWFSINIKNTRTDAYSIMRSVKAGNLEVSQKRLSRMTGYDCSDMDMEQIMKTTIEKVSDRCVNGGFSPVFYMTLFGGFGAMFYKTLCLLNGEVVRNKEDYVDFGKGVKKLWNCLGYIPSQIGAWIIKLDIKILSLDSANAKRVYNRDHTHANPKFLGKARAVIAGALGVQLNVEEFYDGTIMRRRTIGLAVKEIEPNDIYWANQLFYGSVFCYYLLFAVIRLILFFIF